MEIFTQSARQTAEFGQELASELKGRETLGLVGGLGSGKTTFVQGLAQGLGVKSRLISPTFILRRDYPTKFGGRLYHIDLYRLEENVSRQFQDLGVADFLGKEGNVVVIEWAEKVKKVLPKKTIWIKFSDLGGERRKITLDR